MYSNDECVRFFKQQRAYDRCFVQMRRKWESYGRTAGSICLCDATEEERKALEGILGKHFYEPAVRFTLREFEAALQKTRFAPVALKELLEGYFGEELLTKREKTALREKERSLFFEELEKFLAGRQVEAQVIRWIREMREQQKWGYSVLTAEWKRQEESARSLAQNVGLAADMLLGGQGEESLETELFLREQGEESLTSELFLREQEEESLTSGMFLREQNEVPLAVLAARITNNPHYFDRGTVAGNLLLHALCFLKNREFPKSAYDWRQLLLDSGIAPDPISNTVTVYGIHFETEEGLHPGYEAFFRLREVCTVSLENLKRIRGAYGENGMAFVVENEMVFSCLLEAVRKKEAVVTLLCTSGQMRTASLEVVRMLAEAGNRIYYSGDLDPEGMVIADKLWRRYPKQVVPWRMMEEDYRESLSEEEIEERRLAMLKGIENPWLRDVAALMEKVKRAGYQENLLEKMVEDVWSI